MFSLRVNATRLRCHKSVFRPWFVRKCAREGVQRDRKSPFRVSTRAGAGQRPATSLRVALKLKLSLMPCCNKGCGARLDVGLRLVPDRFLGDRCRFGKGWAEDERRAQAAPLERELAAADAPPRGRAARGRWREPRTVGVERLVHVGRNGFGPLVGVAVPVPVEGEDDRLASRGVAIERGPAAAPACSDPVAAGVAEGGQQCADVELAERVLARTPELPDRGRQRDRDRRLPTEEGVDVEDLLARRGEATERGEDRALAPEVLQRRDEADARRRRKSRLEREEGAERGPRSCDPGESE